jgi:Arc/MetJ-type ribon-helix-helix transcriptional regulator
MPGRHDFYFQYPEEFEETLEELESAACEALGRKVSRSAVIRAAVRSVEKSRFTGELRSEAERGYLWGGGWSRKTRKRIVPNPDVNSESA